MCGNVVKHYQYGGVDSTCIVKEATDNLLDAFFTSVVEEATFIGRCGCLIVFSVSDGIGGDWTMLWFVRRWMSITGQLFHDILWHGKINIAFIIIALEVDATIEITGSVFNNVICFFLEGGVQMLKIFLSNIFDSEVIYCKVESYRMGFCFHKPGVCGCSKYPCLARRFLRSLLARMPAWGGHTSPCKSPCRCNH